MEAVKINENTYRIEDDFVRSFLLIGENEALVVDTNCTGTDVRSIAESLTNLPIKLINTHSDGDHTAGNGMFQELYIHEEERPYYNADMTYTFVKDGDVIDLGNRPLEIIHIPGHTPGSIGILDINARVLISGDTIQDGNIFMFTPKRNLPRFLESLKKMGKYDDRYDEIYPSHGSLPIGKGIIPKLIEGGKTILEGKAEGEVMELHGMDVMFYQFDYAGFYCDIPEGK